MRVVLVGSSLSTLVVTLSASVGEHAWGWNAETAASAQHFKQKVDHFDSSNVKTWRQAYYVNDKFWAGPNSDAPVFLWIGGEAPLGGSSVTDNFIVDWLPSTKGLLLSLEHRYYGCHNPLSCPYDVLSPRLGHMQHLSSQQALADLASFHTYATANLGISSSAKWVAFGGSYPGMLAAFVRAVYPDQFFASVASSAPVVGTLNATEFQNVIARAYELNVEGVRGSHICRIAISDGHAEVGRLLATSDGRTRLASLFPHSAKSAEWLETPRNQRTFAGCGVASFPAQGNDPNCQDDACGISQICTIMGNSSLGAPIDRLAAVAKAQASLIDVPVMHCDMDWEMPLSTPPAALNYWGYQTCTEFGFYQTCEAGTECFYTQGLVSFSNEWHRPNDFCVSQFNISTEHTLRAIAETNAYYGAKIAAATRIIWPNGDVDPWSGLSHLAPPGMDQPVIYPISGARHHAWTTAAKDDDQQSIKDARTTIYSTISEWLISAQMAVV